MGLIREKYKKRMRWEILPVVLLLAILCISTISSAEEEGTGTEIFVNGTMTQNGTGESRNSPFNNMEEAIAKAETGSTIWITGTVTVENGEEKSWSIDPEEKAAVVVKRHEEFRGNMVRVDGGTLKLSDVVFDGNNTKVEAMAEGGSMIQVAGQGRFVLEDGGVLRNNTVAGTSQDAKGGAVFAEKNSQVEITGGRIVDNAAGKTGVGSGDGGAIFLVGCDFIMTGGEISGNSAIATSENTGMGSAIYIANNYGSGNKTIISGGEMSNNKASRGCIAVMAGTALEIRGGKIHDNESLIGGALYIGGLDSAAVINGGEISGNSSGNNGGAAALYGGSLTLNDGKISRNTAGTQGGGLYVHNVGRIEINGGEITENTAVAGGGVYVVQNAELKMTGGKINHNKANNSGGGMDNRSGHNTEISGGEICRNEAYLAAGLVLQGRGEMEISGVKVNDNISTTSAAVNIINIIGSVGTKVKIYESEVKGNKAGGDGAGLYLGNSVEAEIKDTQFTNNESGDNGGAIWTPAYEQLTLDSVTFSNNTASEGYFWTVDPSASSGNSYYHNMLVKNCTYSQGPLNDEKTIYGDYTNAYNNYDVVYIKPSGGGVPNADSLNITKTITAGGSGGLVAVEEEVTYGISYEVKKNYDGILANVYIRDILPDGAELTGCSGTYKLYDENGVLVSLPADARIIEWNLGAVSSNTSGTLTVKVKALKKAGGSIMTNKAGIIAEQEYLEKWDEAEIEVDLVEVIEFTVPKTFDYGSAEIELRKQYFGLDWQDSADEETGENLIAVEDTRRNMAADWKLYANLSEYVIDENGTGSNRLDDVLVYCKDGAETPLMKDTNLLIADKAEYSSEYNWISEDWYQDYKSEGQYPTDGTNAKGLYMVLQPGQGSVSDYKGEITWVLAYTP